MDTKVFRTILTNPIIDHLDGLRAIEHDVRISVVGPNDDDDNEFDY